jgi:hypothetical protein
MKVNEANKVHKDLEVNLVHPVIEVFKDRLQYGSAPRASPCSLLPEG